LFPDLSIWIIGFYKPAPLLLIH